MTYTNHLSIDSSEVTHKNKKITSAMESNAFKDFYDLLDESDFEVLRVIPQTNHRPDLLSWAEYGTPNRYWVIMMANNFDDPFEDFTVKELIKLPKV